MYKPTFEEGAGVLLIGLGVVLALALATDFGLSGAALAGIFTMLAEYGRTARRGKRCPS